jgi:hypothetical protein
MPPCKKSVKPGPATTAAAAIGSAPKHPLRDRQVNIVCHANDAIMSSPPVFLGLSRARRAHGVDAKQDAVVSALRPEMLQSFVADLSKLLGGDTTCYLPARGAAELGAEKVFELAVEDILFQECEIYDQSAPSGPHKVEVMSVVVFKDISDHFEAMRAHGPRGAMISVPTVLTSAVKSKTWPASMKKGSKKAVHSPEGEQV